MEGAVLQARCRESYLAGIPTKRPAGTDTALRFATRSKGNERSAANHDYIRNSNYNNPITHPLINKPTSTPNPPQPPHKPPRTAVIYRKSSCDGKQYEQALWNRSRAEHPQTGTGRSNELPSNARFAIEVLLAELPVDAGGREVCFGPRGVGHRSHEYHDGGGGKEDGDVAQDDGGEGAVGADDAVCVDFRAVGCCYSDCLCWAEVEVLRGCHNLALPFILFLSTIV